MELNPALDVRNKTAQLAVDLIESLFGKSTLMRPASPGLNSGPLEVRGVHAPAARLLHRLFHLRRRRLAQTAPTIATRQVGTATLQNVPEIRGRPRPCSVSELPHGAVPGLAVGRLDPHCDALRLDQQIIVTAGGDRADHFQSEPVAGHRAIPGTQRFIISRDTGGDGGSRRTAGSWASRCN